jgi:hypothetical protein
MDTVIMGNLRLYECGREKDAIYEKEDFSDEDGLRAAELEEEFAELGAGRPNRRLPHPAGPWLIPSLCIMPA